MLRPRAAVGGLGRASARRRRLRHRRGRAHLPAGSARPQVARPVPGVLPAAPPPPYASSWCRWPYGSLHYRHAATAGSGRAAVIGPFTLTRWIQATWPAMRRAAAFSAAARATMLTEQTDPQTFSPLQRLRHRPAATRGAHLSTDYLRSAALARSSRHLHRLDRPRRAGWRALTRPWWRCPAARRTGSGQRRRVGRRRRRAADAAECSAVGKDQGYHHQGRDRAATGWSAPGSPADVYSAPTCAPSDWGPSRLLPRPVPDAADHRRCQQAAAYRFHPETQHPAWAVQTAACGLQSASVS